MDRNLRKRFRARSAQSGGIVETMLPGPKINTISFLEGRLPVVQRNNDIASILHIKDAMNTAIEFYFPEMEYLHFFPLSKYHQVFYNLENLMIDLSLY